LPRFGARQEDDGAPWTQDVGEAALVASLQEHALRTINKPAVYYAFIRF